MCKSWGYHSLRRSYLLSTEQNSILAFGVGSPQYFWIHSNCSVLCCCFSRAVFVSGVQAALKTFEEMQSSGVVPDTRSYTTLMEAYGKAGLCDEAESLLKQMEAAGFIADIVTYGVLVKAFAKAERYHEGLKYYDYVVQHSEPYHEPSQILITQHSAAYGGHRNS